jgi:hypothetical protein
MLRRCAVLVVAAALLPDAASGQYSRDRVSLVLRGEAALQRQELVAAANAFQEAARDTSGLRRATAERMLGVLDWRFYHDNARALGHFGAALATHEDTATTLAEMARMAIAQGAYHRAITLAESARRSAVDDYAFRLAVLQLGRAVTEAALSARVDHDAVRDAPNDSTAALAVAELSGLVRAAPGRLEESQLLLLSGLIAGDGAAATRGVQSYYLVKVGGPAARSQVPAALAELTKLLPQWRRDAPRAERRRLALAFTRARLIDAAALVASEGDEVVAYDRFLRRLARESQEYYRKSLLGESHPDDLTRVYVRASHDLWPQLNWSGAPPRFFPAASDQELARRFGVVLQLGTTGGYYDMHVGHVIGVERRTVTQYGHSATVNLVVLDGMVTNGLQSWAWDDAGAHGGWQRGDTIVQVRPVFVEHAVGLWISANPGRRAREARNIAADSTLDWDAAAADSIAYLPGVAARLLRDGRDALLDSLRRAGVPDSALGDAFVHEASRLYRESSIIAHEGRHAIDDHLDQNFSAEEREFRAKLSEVAFAERPKLVMSAIIHPNIGDATPHGRANARVMYGLLKWMRQHTREIRGLDASRPLLPQLPLLTDTQLRAAFRSMDPLARPDQD